MNLRWCFVLVAFAASMLSGPQTMAQSGPVDDTFVIRDFKTEKGAVLPEARIAFTTYGKLNQARDNAVLLPSHFMAGGHGYEWLIGPGKALNPDELFLIATEMFGNGNSSSPSNTKAPFDGPRFPAITIRDNVEAAHRLLTGKWNIQHVRAVIGFSMGAQQAFQWAVSYPTFMDRIVASAGTAKTYGHGFVRLESQIAAIVLDPEFKKGEYSHPQPIAGKQATSVVWAAWLNSQDWWRLELWRDRTPQAKFEDILEARRNSFVDDDANNLILQMRTWQSNNIGTLHGFNGDTETALRSIQVPVLYMPAETDLYFPLTDAIYEASHIAKCTLAPIPSLWGHQAGAGVVPKDAKFLNDNIGAFMRNEIVPNAQTCRRSN
jgi:homoserine O-acetyltransferase